MLDYSTIESVAQVAALEARTYHYEPLHVRELDKAHPEGFCRRVPFLGTYVPAGWVPAEDIDDLFVDSLGLGSPGEPVLTLDRFSDRVRELWQSGEDLGLGIVEAGQFQVYIRVYRRE